MEITWYKGEEIYGKWERKSRENVTRMVAGIIKTGAIAGDRLVITFDEDDHI